MWITRGYYIISPRFTATLIPPKLQCGIDVEKTLPHYIALTTNKYLPKFIKTFLEVKIVDMLLSTVNRYLKIS